jgi:hypothetical protein
MPTAADDRRANVAAGRKREASRADCARQGRKRQPVAPRPTSCSARPRAGPQAAAGTMRESVREAIEDAISPLLRRHRGNPPVCFQHSRELEDTAANSSAARSICPRKPAKAPRQCAVRSQTRSRRCRNSRRSSASRATAPKSANRATPCHARQPRSRPRTGATTRAPARPGTRTAHRSPGPARSVARQPRARRCCACQEPGLGQRPAARCIPREENTPAPAPVASKTPERNPRHVVESLNSLSVDIARAIDHDASVDLWRRYQRGERDVFTRRLYTLKGQQTFDEIKRQVRPRTGRSATSRFQSIATSDRLRTAAQRCRTRTTATTSDDADLPDFATPARSTPCWPTPVQ